MAPFRPALLATAISTLSIAAAAQTSQEPIVLDRLMVTSAAGFEQKITEAPASISVISEQDLQQKRYGNLAQALEDVEGIDVRQSTGKTGGLNISIRGMPSEYTLILIDGRRQNAPGDVTPNGFGDTSTSFMPPLSAIERIEVIRGPMSTLYGSDAMGGIVNIITKKVADKWGGSVTLDHTFQEDRDYGDASKTTFYASGPLVENLLGLQVRGSLYDREASNLMFDNDTEVVKRGASPVEGRMYNFGARLSLTPNADHDIYLDFERGRQVYNNDECQLGTLDGKNRNCADDPGSASGYRDELRFERDQFALGHTARFSFGTLDSTLTHNTTETLGRSIPDAIVPDGLGNDIPYLAGEPHPTLPHAPIIGSDRELKSTDLVFDTKLVAPVGESHLLTVGGQYRDAEMTDGLANEDFEQQSWAVFVEDEWRLLDKLSLTLGARYEDHDAFGGQISPRAYLVWNTTDNWTLKGGVSKGYKTPDINDLHDGINGVGGQGDTLTIGSPDLEPEESTNTELGIYYDNHAGFNANATFFHNKFKDKIARGDDVFISGNPLIPDDWYSQQINIGKAETQGLELAGSWQFLPGWTLRANYTYTDSEQKSGADKGARLTNTPDHMVYASLNWQATDRLSLWFKGEYRSDRARFTSRHANLTGADLEIQNKLGDLKAYEVFHLGGSFKASENVTLNFTVYNLFDKNFLEGDYYTDNNGVTAWASSYAHISRSMASAGTIEEGRRLWLSANITF